MKYLRIGIFALSLLSFCLRIAFRHDNADGAAAVAKSYTEQVQEQAKQEYLDSLKSAPATADSGDSLKSKSTALPTAAPAQVK